MSTQILSPIFSYQSSSLDSVTPMGPDSKATFSVSIPSQNDLVSQAEKREEEERKEVGKDSL